MTLPELIERHRRHLPASAALFARGEQGGWRRTTAAADVVRAGAPEYGGLYSMVMPGPDAEPAAVLDAVAAAPPGQPFALWTHAPGDEAVATECWQRGLTLHSQIAVMALTDPPTGPPAGAVCLVDAPAGAGRFRGVHARQRGVLQDDAVIAHWCRDEVLLAEEVTAAYTEEGGVPVATAMLVRAGGEAGVYWVATLPGSRGRGHAGRLTATLCNLAFDEGADAVFLQATTLGRPVYRRLGFADLGLAARWVVPAPPDPARLARLASEGSHP